MDQVMDDSFTRKYLLTLHSDLKLKTFEKTVC